MDTLAAVEARRVALQDELDGRKTQKERNRLGQFATPPLLASDMLAYAVTLVPKGAQVRFLDPAVGTGSFYAALLRHFPGQLVEVAVGVEIDPYYGKPARGLWLNRGLKIEIDDFTVMKPPLAAERFNLVVCNPPYVRHHHMGVEEKGRLQAATTAASGVRITGLAGLYCYFLGLAHAWLADDGIAGWLIPSEFMDVNYGGPVKRYLLNEVELLRIHRFDPNDLQFGDALVSSAAVWFRKRRAGLGHEVELSYGGALSRPTDSRRVPASALQDQRKWTGLATSGVKYVTPGLRLADFFTIKRGLATGDNRFFILSRAAIQERGLPFKFFKPILPGPRFLPSDVIEAEAGGAPKIERQQFILDCRLPEDMVREQFPKLWAYLKMGKPTVSDTYLCSRRNPWYSQEQRPPAPFICTYMGRGLTKREKPFRFILNHSHATAANVYLMLYPIPALSKALEGDPELVRQIWKFLDSIPSEILLKEGRVYGGGLYKMEPKELANVPAEALARLLPTTMRQPAKQHEMFAKLAM
jgi:adenine-specific DNA-methyltransferase